MVTFIEKFLMKNFFFVQRQKFFHSGMETTNLRKIDEISLLIRHISNLVADFEQVNIG